LGSATPAATAGAATVWSVTVKVAPRFLPRLSALIVPPCALTIAFEMASPRPRPPKRRVIELCPCSNALKILSI
jgi:hypothetical protein